MSEGQPPSLFLISENSIEYNHLRIREVFGVAKNLDGKTCKVLESLILLLYAFSVGKTSQSATVFA